MMIDFVKMQADLIKNNETINEIKDNIDLLIRSDGYMCLKRAAKYIDISESTMRRYLKEIPHFQRDRLILFRKSDLDKWLDRYKIAL